MTSDSKSPPPTQSFSPARRWKIGFDVILRTLVVLAVIVMINYISGLFSKQFFLSSRTRVKLSPHTVSILQSLTNHVDVTVYYDKDDRMFSTIMALLNEYHRIDPRISIKVVDYNRDPAEAAVMMQKYHLPSAKPNEPPLKNLVIFDSDGHTKAVTGESLVQLGPNGIIKDKQIEFGPVAFKGEMAFTATLQAVTNPKPFMAYYMMGRGEPSPVDTGDYGFLKFALVLRDNYVQLAPLTLQGDTDVPSDCNLLIIAGPKERFSDSELAKIDHYISHGGRLLVLLDYSSVSQPTGLEGVLKDYGVNVVADIVQDKSSTMSGNDILVQNFNSHAIVNPLMGRSELQLFLPRPVFTINDPNAPPGAPTVTWLATSSGNSLLAGERGAAPQSYPLMAAVEGNSANKGTANSQANMRMVVIGESLFLNNKCIDAAANRDFAGYAVNWLLDRPLLLSGIGPSPVLEYRLIMTKAQLRNVRWLLVGALPATALTLGGLVWLRRRK